MAFMPIEGVAWTGVTGRDISQSFRDLNKRIPRLFTQQLSYTVGMKSNALAITDLIYRDFIASLVVPVTLRIPEIA
jgi:hypothetical protein